MKQPRSRLFLLLIAACWRAGAPLPTTARVREVHHHHYETIRAPCVDVDPPPMPCEVGVPPCDERDPDHYRAYNCSGMLRDDCDRVADELWVRYGVDMASWWKYQVRPYCMKTDE